MNAKKYLQKLLKALGLLVLLAIMAVGVFLLLWLNRDHHEDHVIAGSPFDQHFTDGIYPPRPDQIEAWFLSAVPSGTHVDDARSILAKSFMIDLTTGDREALEVTENTAGGSYTKVRLIFDAGGRFQSIEVEQYWAYL